MNRKRLVGFAICFACVLLAAGGALGVPGLLNFQGKLADDAGTPLNGSYNLYFRIYDAATGGTELWAEQHNNVLVINGIYNVQLGSGDHLDAAVFSGDARYLQVEVYNSDSSSWEVLSPRLRITSVAFSIKAGDAETLQGYEPTDFAPVSHTHDFSEITGTATDAQIPDNITIDNASNADTLDNHDSSYFATASHTHSGNDITSGTVAEAYIDDAITRDTELSAGLAGKSDVGHNHDDRYYTKSYIDALEKRIKDLETKLASMSVSGNDVFFTGVNVHIVNGTGHTETVDANATGNLIVGYNETRGSGDDRSGSHNIVVGSRHNYSSYGGFVAGYYNSVSGPYATVSGGSYNTASGSFASVSGGGGDSESDGNEAFADYSSILGGRDNVAGDKVSGDHTLATQSTVSGGSYNTASGWAASVSGGGGGNPLDGNEAFADYSSILGGRDNVAGDKDSGNHHLAEQSTVSGGLGNEASGSFASVSGGSYNTASGDYASVSGGHNRSASGEYNWAAGSLYEDY